MTLDEARGLAEAAQRRALEAEGLVAESKRLHVAVAEWRQVWEVREMAVREAAGHSELSDGTISMMSEMAYREAFPEEWQRFVDVTWQVRAAQHEASMATAAAQMTATVANMEAEEQYQRLEEGYRQRQLGEGEDDDS